MLVTLADGAKHEIIEGSSATITKRVDISKIHMMYYSSLSTATYKSNSVTMDWNGWFVQTSVNTIEVLFCYSSGKLAV